VVNLSYLFVLSNSALQHFFVNTLTAVRSL